MTQSTSKTKYELPSKLPLEVTLVFLLQLALIIGLVQIDSIFSFGGNLLALVGVVFILVPVVVLDRRDRPYRRYGIDWGKPQIDLLWAIGAILATLPIAAYVIPIVWRFLSIFELGAWSLTWPHDYPKKNLLKRYSKN